jgi:hypothetical protein
MVSPGGTNSSVPESSAVVEPSLMPVSSSKPVVTKPGPVKSVAWESVPPETLVGGGSVWLVLLWEAELSSALLVMGTVSEVPGPDAVVDSVSPAPASTEEQAARLRSIRQAKRTRMGSMRADGSDGCNRACGPC